MTETRVEPLSGGLVTSRSIAHLEAGELTRADDCFYRPGSASISKIPGRTAFTNATPGAVTGCGYVSFADATAATLVQDATDLYSASSTGGAVSVLRSGFTGPSLVVVQYGGRHVLLNGQTANRVVKAGPITRSHGLIAVTQPPGLQIV